MRKVFISLILLIASMSLQAFEQADLQGKWLVESFQPKNGGQVIKGDGTDFWEFSNNKYSVYSSGSKISTTDFIVTENTLTIKAIAGDHSIEIVDVQPKTMKVNDGYYIYNLVKQ